MKSNIFYVVIIAMVLLAFTVVFDTLPRSTVSKLEKRDLATFPEFTPSSLFSGEFTSQVSSWFSDTEPYRDVLMALSMNIDDWKGLNVGNENVKFHADKPKPKVPDRGDDGFNPNASDIARKASSGIVVVGEEPNVRALMCYGGDGNGGVDWANAVNEIKVALGPGVKVYAMLVPLSSEFYMPDDAKKYSKPQLPTIENVNRNLKDVIPVNAYEALRCHTRENIYLRTDHHWSPLGAFYATREFARVAGVKFGKLSKGYVRKVIPGYVGTMYHYSRDMSVKRSPEDFIYWEPIDTTYTVTTISFQINKNFAVVGESAPMKSKFFFHFKRASAAYETFMGGDCFLVKVQTRVHNGRRLMIMKDSYGNVPPAYLFYSFEEIHVADNRYFTKNLVDYVRENGITDFLIINDIYAPYDTGLIGRYRHYLKQ